MQPALRLTRQRGRGKQNEPVPPLLLLITAAACVHGSDGEGWSLHVGDGVPWREWSGDVTLMCDQRKFLKSGKELGQKSASGFLKSATELSQI